MGKTVENYLIQEALGQGNFAKVFKAKNIKTGQDFAIKVIPTQKFKDIPKLEECTVNEINILSQIRNQSEYIVNYIDMLKTSNNYYFVYEFCNGGTLDKMIQKEGHFSEQKSLKYLKQILEGFKVLNKHNIMHRDLKPENILLHNGNIKLADFSFCKLLQNKTDLTQTMLGSPIYMAPQVLKGQIYTMKADIWSMGIVLYKMLFGKCPFQSKSIAMLIKLLEKQELQIPNDIKITPITQQFLRKVLVKDANLRINWDQIFNTYQITDQGEIVYKKGFHQAEQSQLRTSTKINGNFAFNTIRHSYSNNANNGLVSNNYNNGNLMNMVSPKANIQIMQGQSSTNGIANKSFQPSFDQVQSPQVQSPILDKGLLAKKSPFKIQQQRNTVELKNSDQNNNMMGNFRSGFTTHEGMSNFLSQPNCAPNNNQNGFRVSHQNSLDIAINKEAKNDRVAFTKAEILIKIHQKCSQINQMTLEIFMLNQEYSNYISYFIFKNLTREIEGLNQNLKKQISNDSFWREFKVIIQNQILLLTKINSNFHEAILEDEKQLKLFNDKSQKSIDEQLSQNRQKILKLYIQNLADTDESIRLASQVTDYLIENILIKKEAYDRMNRDHLYKQIKSKVLKQ